MSEIYDQFTKRATQSIEKGLMYFSEYQKTGKEYNDFLVNFLKGSTLTVTNHCSFSDKKKKDTLVKILSPLPIIDDELFKFLGELRDKNPKPKRIIGFNTDYGHRTAATKENIIEDINIFVKERTDKTIQEYYQKNYDSLIEPITTELNDINNKINNYELEIRNIETYNIDNIEEMPSEDIINDKKEELRNLKERKLELELEYMERDQELKIFGDNFMKEYGPKKKQFHTKITEIAQSYIFAKKGELGVNHPLQVLKESYVKLFLLDDLDEIHFHQAKEYNFELGTNTIQEINNKKQHLTNILTKENNNGELKVFSKAS